MYQHNQLVVKLFDERNAVITECAYSAITRVQLLDFPGITEKEQGLILSLLKRMTHIGIDESIEDATITLKRNSRIKLPDAIILATAKTYHLELLTLDKHLANKL